MTSWLKYFPSFRFLVKSGFGLVLISVFRWKKTYWNFHIRYSFFVYNCSICKNFKSFHFTHIFILSLCARIGKIWKVHFSTWKDLHIISMHISSHHTTAAIIAFSKFTHTWALHETSAPNACTHHLSRLQNSFQKKIFIHFFLQERQQ